MVRAVRILGEVGDRGLSGCYRRTAGLIDIEVCILVRVEDRAIGQIQHHALISCDVVDRARRAVDRRKRIRGRIVLIKTGGRGVTGILRRLPVVVAAWNYCSNSWVIVERTTKSAENPAIWHHGRRRIGRCTLGQESGTWNLISVIVFRVLDDIWDGFARRPSAGRGIAARGVERSVSVTAKKKGPTVREKEWRSDFSSHGVEKRGGKTSVSDPGIGGRNIALRCGGTGISRQDALVR